jgi:two-component system, cell cycle sensor histidine kinase and response regulator CckA
MLRKKETASTTSPRQQLDQAENMLRKLLRAVEQSADMVVITDRSGIIEYANPAFETLTGYSCEEVVGCNPSLLNSGEQVPALYRELWQTILSGNVFRGVLANRKKTGELFYVEKTITPVRDGEGRITHFISNDRDITERRKLEAELRQAQKMDAIGRLAGGVAHDFNNLLLVISAYAELTLDVLAEENPLRRNLLEILTASRRAADLTRQLLAFGRKQMQVLQLLDMNSVVQQISAMLPRLIGEDIQLVVVPGQEIGSVKADPVQMEQILMNLAANARDAMPGGGTLTIETSVVHLDEVYAREHTIVPPGEYVLLAVTDSGQGIAPEHINHIFEPFYTTKEEGKGTGLGLATVYGIVKQNHGFVWVYSELGLGTTFKIYLPCVRSAKLCTPVPKLVEDCRGGNETVLLVEDEAAVRESTTKFLTLNGYTVLEARNGQDALQIARDYLGLIHLMVSDVVMPHMGGAQVAEQLATERPTMKVLFMSGYAESTILRHGVIDVQNGFLQKPFTLKALARKIREILERSEPARTRAASCP